MAENSTSVGTMSFTDPESGCVSLRIFDQADSNSVGTNLEDEELFIITGNANAGYAIAFKDAPDFDRPADADNNATHKIMKFKILKSSIRAYQRNLNTHSGYKEFRMARAALRDNRRNLDGLILATYLNRYAETGTEYVKIIKQIIKQNNLTDFDKVKLLPSSIQLKSLI